jgi:hypothetical protein
VRDRKGLSPFMDLLVESEEAGFVRHFGGSAGQT